MGNGSKGRTQIEVTLGRREDHVVDGTDERLTN